jgi:hypothetical protein
MIRHVALVRAEFSEGRSASINRVTRIGELRTTLAVTSTEYNISSQRVILITMMMEALTSFNTSFFTGATLCSITGDGILQHVPKPMS